MTWFKNLISEPEEKEGANFDEWRKEQDIINEMNILASKLIASFPSNGKEPGLYYYEWLTGQFAASGLFFGEDVYLIKNHVYMTIRNMVEC